MKPEAAIAYSTNNESPALGPGLVNLTRHDQIGEAQPHFLV